MIKRARTYEFDVGMTALIVPDYTRRLGLLQMNEQQMFFFNGIKLDLYRNDSFNTSNNT